MQRIDSSDNKRLKRLASLRQKKVRLEENLFLIEGIKIIREAMAEKAEIDMVLLSDSFHETNRDLCSELDMKYHVYLTNEHNLAKCSSLKTPPGILASVKREAYEPVDVLDSGKPLVILDGVSDPGNMGTIIRTADAFGFGGVLLLPGCTDPYSPKTVQSTMGSVFRIKIIDAEIDNLDLIINSGYKVFGLDMKGSNIAGESFGGVSPAIVIGNESHGISESVRRKCSGFLRINMRGKAESLNASVAAGIAMHEISGNQVDNKQVD